MNKKIIPHKQHKIKEQGINKNALTVFHRLKKMEFEAYFVGGCIRDLLLKKHPKDFDITTSAHPNQIKKIFQNCRLIGRRFRLAHIYFKKDIIELATFRASAEKAKEHEVVTDHGMIIRSNVYGTMDEDAERRDFTINALYYDPENQALTDFFNGYSDLQKKLVRMIGKPEERYREDPVRMLRAIRFAAKLDFKIEKKTEEPFKTLGHLLENVSPARLYDEVLKLLQHGEGLKGFQLLRQYQLLPYLFPQTHDILKQTHTLSFIEQMLKNTDLRVQNKKAIVPAFMYAALLWFPTLKTWQQLLCKRKSSKMYAFELAAKQIIKAQTKKTTIPRYVIANILEIWKLQFQLERRRPRQIVRILEHGRFRAAYDFLLLRSAIDKNLAAITSWWTEIQTASKSQQFKMIEQLQYQHANH